MKNEMWLIWKQPDTRRRYKIGSLNYDGKEYIFKYINPELNDAITVGFSCFPGFENIDKVYRSNKLFANIETRLPNVNRPDYLEILNKNGLEKDSTKFEILRATKGRLITDSYEFVPAFDRNKVVFDVAGTRYSLDLKKCYKLINLNDKLELELELLNNEDENAIKIIISKNNKKYHIGYVPRYYTKELADLLKDKVKYSALVQSLNFESKFYDEDITVLVKLIFD